MAKPITCPRCARENDPRFVFCLDCGQPLRAAADGSACPACGAPLQPGFRFCGACGKPAGEPPPARRAAGPTGSPHAARPVAPPAAPGAAPRFRLTLVRSDGTPGASFPLDASEVVCGRAEGAVRLADDPTVSPRHARFTQRDGRLSVEDLGSVNGTFVRLREPRRLAPGAELRVGRQLLRLEPLPRAPGDHPTPATGSASRSSSRTAGSARSSRCARARTRSAGRPGT